MSRPIIGFCLIIVLLGLLTGCNGGSSTSAPSVTLTATPVTITAGQGVTLRWTTTQNASISASNFNAPIATTNVTLIPVGTTTYSITMQHNGRETTATATVQVITPTAPSSVPGFLLPIYSPGVEVPVVLTVIPTSTTQNYAVEDCLPIGWNGIDIDNNGSWDSQHHMVKWGPFDDNQMRIFHYTAVPPTLLAGAQIFSGVASFDGVSVPTIGDRVLN